MFDFDHVLNEKKTNLGLNKRAKKTYDSEDAIDNITEFVDLGLPSGNLWCKHNYGASNCYEAGECFSHEDAVNLDMSPGHLPTREDYMELTDYCTLTWKVLDNNITGMEVVSKKNGQSIFFPAVGYFYQSPENIRKQRHLGIIGFYWSSSKCHIGSSLFRFTKSYYNPEEILASKYQFPLRAVMSKANESRLGLNKRAKDIHGKKTEGDVSEEIGALDTQTIESMIETTIDKLKADGNPISREPGEENSISYEHSETITKASVSVINYLFWNPGTRVTEVEVQAPSMFFEIAFVGEGENGVVGALAVSLCLRCNRKSIRCYISEDSGISSIAKSFTNMIRAISTIGASQKDLAKMLDDFYISTAKPKDTPWVFWPTNAIIEFDPAKHETYVLTPKWEEKVREILRQLGLNTEFTTGAYKSFIS